MKQLRSNQALVSVAASAFANNKVSVDCNSTYSIRVFQELSQINDVHIQ
jgi:hypothetical protein